MKAVTVFIRLLFLSALLLPAELAAENLRTVSGKIFRNYKITRVTWNRVQILYSGGGTWLKHEELPNDILQQYEAEIERQKLLHEKSTGTVIMQKITQAQQTEDPAAAITLLEKIKQQHPGHELTDKINSLLKVKQHEADAVKLLATENSGTDLLELIEKMNRVLPGISNPELKEKLSRAIELKREQLKNQAEIIEQEINTAAELQDLEKAIQDLKSILIRYPHYPLREQQSSYQDRVEQLIQKKQQQLDAEKVRLTDRLQNYIKNNPDAENGLKRIFQHVRNVDSKLAEKIVQDSGKLEQVMKTAEQQSQQAALESLRQALWSYEHAVNKRMALQKIEELEKSIRQKAERAARIAHLKQIRVFSGSNGEFVIKKHINWNNDWSLLLVPVSEKQRVCEIWDAYRKYHKDWSLFKQYRRQSDDYHRKGSYFLQAAASSMQAATSYHNSARKYLNEGNKLLRQLRENGVIDYSVDSNICSLSNLSGSVIFVASESVLSGHEYIHYFWYFEYIPGRSGSYWNISEAY